MLAFFIQTYVKGRWIDSSQYFVEIGNLLSGKPNKAQKYFGMWKEAFSLAILFFISLVNSSDESLDHSAFHFLTVLPVAFVILDEPLAMNSLVFGILTLLLVGERVNGVKIQFFRLNFVSGNKISAL